MKLILHIGSPKAGSSAIQTGVHRRRDGLAQDGIAYVQNPRALSTLYENMQRLPMPLQARFDTIDAARGWSADNWDRFEADIQRDAPRLTLLSSEHFLNLPDPRAFLERLGRNFSDIHAIAYVRDPVSMFQSNIDQRIRSGARICDLFSAWELNNPMWVAAALDRYLDVLGHDRLHVRAFERSNLTGADVVVDYFARVSEISGLKVAPPEKPVRDNESFGAAATAWLLIANEMMLDKGRQLDTAPLVAKRKDLIHRIRESRTLRDLPKLKLDDPVITAFVRHQTSDGCRHINDTYLRGQVPLGTGERLSDVPEPEELRRRTLAWVMSYLTPESLALLTSELVRID